MITCVRGMTVNELANRKDDLIISNEDIHEIAKNARNMAIEKFEREIRDWQGDIRDNEHDADKYNFVFERIYEIAEEMRGAE